MVATKDMAGRGPVVARAYALASRPSPKQALSSRSTPIKALSQGPARRPTRLQAFIAHLARAYALARREAIREATAPPPA